MPLLSGTGALSARGFGFTTDKPYGAQEYTAVGTYSFLVPRGVTSLSIVTVGGGGGGTQAVEYSGTTPIPAAPSGTPIYGSGGGALAYVNSISVTPGEFLTVVVGSGGAGGRYNADYGNGILFGGDGTNSYVSRGATKLVEAGGGKSGNTAANGGVVVTGTGYPGGAGGAGTDDGQHWWGVGSGGAGGYSGAGGAGGNANANGSNGSGGSPGGGAGGTACYYNQSIYTFYLYLGGGSGGGIGLLGEGSSGTGGVTGSSGSVPNVSSVVKAGGGTGGSGGENGQSPFNNIGSATGGRPGAGSSCTGSSERYDNNTGTSIYSAPVGAQGGHGAVRLIWATDGTTRAFPSTNTGNL